MTDLPEVVYLVTVDGEWPVSAFADCHPSTPEIVEHEFKRRTSDSPFGPSRGHVWKATLADIQEVDLISGAWTAPALRERAAVVNTPVVDVSGADDGRGHITSDADPGL